MLATSYKMVWLVVVEDKRIELELIFTDENYYKIADVFFNQNKYD